MKRVLRKQNHCAYECIYHIVLCAKYRREIFNDGVFAYMKATLKELNAHYPELDIKEINHDKDHIHIMMWIPPRYAVSKVVNTKVLRARTAIIEAKVKLRIGII